jgi:hypothetical protein
MQSREVIDYVVPIFHTNLFGGGRELNPFLAVLPGPKTNHETHTATIMAVRAQRINKTLG